MKTIVVKYKDGSKTEIVSIRADDVFEIMEAFVGRKDKLFMLAINDNDPMILNPREIQKVFVV